MDEGALRPAWLLALETATQVTSVAVLRDGEVAAELHQPEAVIHSERLLPAIDRVLAQAGIGIAEIEAFALSIGPGSFTGLRIGLATVKGLALGDLRPVAPVSTLAGLAAGAGEGGEPVAVLLDARRGQVYAGAYRASSFLEPIVAESVYHPEELAALLPRPCRVVVGEGAAAAARTLAAAGAGIRLLPASRGVARATRVGRLGLALLAAGGAVTADALLPRYLRRAEAEARRLGQPLEDGGPARV